MCVRSAEPKRADPREPGSVAPPPRPQFRRDLHRQLVPGDVRIRLPEMQVRWQLFVLQGERDFDQPGDPSRRFQVPDVRLDGTDHQRLIRRPSLTVRRP